MIPFDFNYYCPTTFREAVELYLILDKQQKNPVYYSGGTEIITLGRLNLLQTGAVVDIKYIPESTEMYEQDGRIVLGSGLTLSEVADANIFPLLTKTSSEVADRTARNKITLGGNICGNIYYREAVLPYLLTDSQAIIAGPNGLKQVPFHQIFKQTLRLEKGEFLIQLVTPIIDSQLPFISIKRRRQWDTGYPLVTMAAIKKEEEMRVAFSGLSPFPYRAYRIEKELNQEQYPMETRIENAIQFLEQPILNDEQGSREYRIFVVRNLLQDMMLTWKGEGNG